MNDEFRIVWANGDYMAINGDKITWVGVIANRIRHWIYTYYHGLTGEALTTQKIKEVAKSFDNGAVIFE